MQDGLYPKYLRTTGWVIAAEKGCMKLYVCVARRSFIRRFHPHESRMLSEMELRRRAHGATNVIN